MFRLLDMIARRGPNNCLHSIGVFSIHHQISSSWFWELQDLAAKYGLPSPLSVLLSPQPKSVFKKLVKTKITQYWRKYFISSIRDKPSLQFIRAEFLPFGSGPHPLWLSCGGSVSAVKAAIVQARIISGKYKDDKMLSKFDDRLSGKCTLSGCDFFPDDTTHWLSFQCQALAPALTSTFNNVIEVLRPWPLLLDVVHDALSRSPVEWAKFVVDPSTYPSVIVIKQQFGEESIWPLFKLSRALIWCFHKEQKRLKGLNIFQV